VLTKVNFEIQMDLVNHLPWWLVIHVQFNLILHPWPG